MGQAIEKIALERGHVITARISKANQADLESALADTDVAIEFTRPESVLNHLRICIQKNIPVVCGTTGWLHFWNQILELTSQKKGALVYSSNFSVGVQLFFCLNRKLAALMATHDEYQCSLTEIHHTHKLDAPSGTAISLAKDIIDQHPGYKEWQLDTPESASPLLNIQALRKDEVIGTHYVKYLSPIDEIEIKHEAFSRIGFAKGAVLAAEWVQGKQGVYTMQDVLGLDNI